MKTLKSILLMTLLHFFTNAQTIIQSENFTGNSLPAGWSYDSAGTVPVYNWKFSGSPTTVSGAGFDNEFVRVYSYVTIPTNVLFDCSLISSAFNCSLNSSVYLTISEQAVSNNPPSSGNFDIRNIEISNDGGVTWINVFSCTNCLHGYPTAVKNIIDISSVAANQASVKIKFNYQAHNNGWWAIDNILVTDSAVCQSPPDSGFAVSTPARVCTGSPVSLHLENLSRGIGQTYQWQLKNNNTGNVWSNIAGAVTDTVSITQNGSTYYQCLITCGGLSTNSLPVMVKDTPTLAYAYNDGIHFCAGKADTLRLRDPHGGYGIGYQWLQSFNIQTGYSNIPGAVHDTLIVQNYAGSYFFICNQVCLSNGIESTQAGWVNVVSNPNPMCYCYPQHNNPCSNGYFISNVSITGTTLNHNALCDDTHLLNTIGNNYQFFDPAIGNQTAVFQKNATYTINLSTDSMWQQFIFWIDYDLNGVFDSTESVYAGYASPGAPATAQFTVPLNAGTGQTGLRVRSTRFQPLYGTSACVGIIGGSTYDYIVTIDSTVGVMNNIYSTINVEVYPNPAKDKLTITSHNIITTAKLLSATGSVVMQQKTVLSSKVVFDVSSLPAGIYFAEVITDKGRVMRKWIKE